VRILALLFLTGVVEISVLIVVGKVIGALPTLGLLIAGAFVGSWVLRREGRRTVREFTEAARLRRPPARELSDGVLVAAGGVLIMVPGFISDIVGALCLVPPIRTLLRRRLQLAAERRSRTLHERMTRAQRAYRDGSGAVDSDVIDGEVVSVTEDDEDTATAPDQHRPLDSAARTDPPRRPE
jgi:UPF0716 protein FxsA